MQDKRLAGALAVSITVVALAWATFGSDGDEGGAGADARRHLGTRRRPAVRAQPA
jgi:hypothetical protein